MKKYFILAILSTCLVGCSSQVMRLSTMSPTNKNQIVGRCSGESGGFLLFGCIPIKINDRLERAYNECLADIGASRLTNVSVVERWFYTPAGNGFITTVKGDGIR